MLLRYFEVSLLSKTSQLDIRYLYETNLMIEYWELTIVFSVFGFVVKLANYGQPS